MRSEEVSMLMAVDRQRRLVGTLTADEAVTARKEQRSLREVMNQDVITVTKDTLVSELFPLIYDSPTPLAVVENEKLLGVIIRGSVIESLTDTSEKDTQMEVTAHV